MKTILLIGGDKRSLYLRAYLERRDFFTYGFAQKKGEPLALGRTLLAEPPSMRMSILSLLIAVITAALP